MAYIAEWVWKKRLAEVEIYQDGMQALFDALDYPPHEVACNYEWLHEMRELIWSISEQANQSNLFFNRNKEKSVL